MNEKILNGLKLVGIDLIKFKNFVIGLPSYLENLWHFKKRVHTRGDESSEIIKLKPIIGDANEEAGSVKGHYFLQDTYVAKRVIKNSPKKHVDIGSRIDGFVANLSTSMKVEVFDVRPMSVSIENIVFNQIDIVKDIEKIEKGYCDSLSCLHTLEHIGLGRYGDKLDVMGHIKAIDAISKLVKKGGRVYLSTPIGPGRVEFNAHRVFDLEYIFGILDERFKISRFSYIDDSSNIHVDVSLDNEKLKSSCGCQYGCGIFEMVR